MILLLICLAFVVVYLLILGKLLFSFWMEQFHIVNLFEAGLESNILMDNIKYTTLADVEEYNPNLAISLDDNGHRVRMTIDKDGVIIKPIWWTETEHPTSRNRTIKASDYLKKKLTTITSEIAIMHKLQQNL